MLASPRSFRLFTGLLAGALSHSIGPLLLLRPAPCGDGGPTAEELEQALQNLITKHKGEATDALRVVLADNVDYRAKNAGLKKENTDLQARVPGQGSVVLSPEQARDWEAYRAAGTPDVVRGLATQVTTLTTERDGLVNERDTLAGDRTTLATERDGLIKERDELATKSTQLEQDNAKTARQILLRDVAPLAGPRPFKVSVLTDLDERTPGLSYEIKDIEEKGQKVKRAFVKYPESDAQNAPLKEVALHEFAEQRWGDYLPALQSEPVTSAQGAGRHVPQGSGGISGNGNNGAAPPRPGGLL